MVSVISANIRINKLNFKSVIPSRATIQLFSPPVSHRPVTWGACTQLLCLPEGLTAWGGACCNVFPAPSSSCSPQPCTPLVGMDCSSPRKPRTLDASAL